MGRRRRRCSGAPAPAASSTPTATRAGRSRGSSSGRSNEIHAGAYDPVARLELMDELGVHAQVIFPGVVGLGGQSLSRGREGRRAAHCCASRSSTTRTRRSRRRRATGCCRWRSCPAWDVDACVREAQRSADLGMRGVNITSDPQDLGAPDLASRAWDPLWEACSRLALPGALPHRGEPHDDELLRELPVAVARRRHASSRSAARCCSSATAGSSSTSSARACSTGFPELKIVSVESGAGLGPVHPRGARLRDGGERRRS